MRLLNTTTLKLHEFFDAEIPQYAILSHTWGAEEVTFQEMTDVFDEDGCQCGKANKRAKTLAKAGYQKIWACCRQAKSDGLYYAWVDTCCIDKSSSAELSEAINSMWLWYERSAICYVYLEDVELRNVQSGVDFERQLTRCRWVTRGWCLQELLAPYVVLFLAQDWSKIGIKGEDHLSRYSDLRVLTKQISKVTRIPKKALTSNYPRLGYSIAQKLSWAANRQTTRREDQAYCLIGLLGVNMPLLYGEGHRAFYRLQEELIRTQADHSILAFKSTATDDAVMGVLADSPEAFKDSGNIMPPDGEIVPYRMTNRGLEIELDVGIWHDPRYYVALLSCLNKSGDQITILLHSSQDLRDSNIGDLVYRAGAGRLGPFTLDESTRKQIEESGGFQWRKLLIARDAPTVL